jgi:hypothetical protein
METNEYNEIKDLLHKQDLKLTRIEEKLNDYNDIKEKSSKADERSRRNEQDIKELQERNKWLTRAIAGALITALVGLLFVFVKLGMGV